MSRLDYLLSWNRLAYVLLGLCLTSPRKLADFVTRFEVNLPATYRSMIWLFLTTTILLLDPRWWLHIHSIWTEFWFSAASIYLWRLIVYLHLRLNFLRLDTQFRWTSFAMIGTRHHHLLPNLITLLAHGVTNWVHALSIAKAFGGLRVSVHSAFVVFSSFLLLFHWTLVRWLGRAGSCGPP